LVPDSLLVQAAAGTLPFADGAFDRVICVNALHHFVNKAQFLKEARRVLRPAGGIISIGLDPHSGRDRWWIYDYFSQTIDLDRQRYPSVATIRAQMAKAGFGRCETREVEHIVGAISVESARATGHLDRSFKQFTIPHRRGVLARSAAYCRCRRERVGAWRDAPAPVRPASLCHDWLGNIEPPVAHRPARRLLDA